MNPLLKILPPIWFFIFLGLGLLAHFFVPASRVFDISSPLGWIAGGVLFAASFGLSLYASGIFSKEKTEILPISETNRVLVTYGPYEYTRNPMYMGMVGQLVGVALMCMGSLPLLLAALADFLVLNFVFIPFEEAKMQRLFGESYASYRSKVRRWL